METDEPPENSLRRIIHDLNGELFLIRGYIDLTLSMVSDDEVAKSNLSKILERTDEFEKIIRRLRSRQHELEPES